MTQPTAYAYVNDLLDRLRTNLQTILGDNLVGLYLYGSLVMGGFDEDISDVDLLAALAADLDENQFRALQQMHDQLVRDEPQWDNRIEVAYLSLRGLKTFKTESSKLGIISPGESFHIVDAGVEWLMNWYMVREKGLTLTGPPPQAIIDPMPQAEFIQAVKDHMAAYRHYIDKAYSRPDQAYAILTVCRGLYTTTHGEQVSKRAAALWAKGELPEWAWLIENALLWRQNWREPVADPDATRPDTERFVHFVIDRILQ